MEDDDDDADGTRLRLLIDIYGNINTHLGVPIIPPRPTVESALPGDGMTPAEKMMFSMGWKGSGHGTKYLRNYQIRKGALIELRRIG